MDFKLFNSFCAIPSTAVDEGKMHDFILEYIEENKKKVKYTPTIYSGAGFQDMAIVVFGKPSTAVFAHTDAVGYVVAHNKELFKIGGPKAKSGTKLVGEDSKGAVKCRLVIPERDSEKEKNTGDVFK